MFHALDLGISVDAFWEMTPRAICILVQEMTKATKAARSAAKSAGTASAGGEKVVRLNYIPRP